MVVKVLKNPIDDFWYDQKLKLMAHPQFLNEMGDFYSDKWNFSFKSIGGITTIDFSWFDLPAFKIESIASYYKDGYTYLLSSKEFAKLACIALLTQSGANTSLPTYQMMLQIFAFLKENNATVLNCSLLKSFWTSFMGKTVNLNGFVNRVSTPSYLGAIKPVQLHKLKNSLKALGVVGVIDLKITSKQIEKSLDVVCQSQYSLTLAEFKKGGSNNFLGLEFGQYYVDYLNCVYQHNFFYTLVCRKTFQYLIDKYGLGNSDVGSNYRHFNVIMSVLIDKDGYKVFGQTRGINHNELKVDAERTFFNEYLKYFESVMSLKDKNIEALVIELGLASRSDAIELVRILMLKKYLGLDGHKTSEDVWQGYLLSLDKTFLANGSLNYISVKDVYSKMQSIINKNKLDKNQFLTDIKCWVTKLLTRSESKTYKVLKAVLDIQLYAMTNLVVAWTGYRKSEFGFPFSAIQPEPNLDILDNAHVPFRFKLKWFVPKTGGTTKINREITSQCYQIAAQLNDVFGGSNNEPCLYSLAGTRVRKEAVNNSEGYISLRVAANWKGFVEGYQPFNDVILLDDLIKNKYLTSLEQEQVEVLSAKYKVGSARYNHLLSSAKEVKRDWLRLSNSSFIGDKAILKFKASLIRFTKNECVENTDHKQIIDAYLSNETKNLLTSGLVDLNDKKTMMDIISEMLGDVRYPSPHAFRHIWAESILTRYQGDVGAVIRHQFAHLDNSFFMAYLREKDARGIITSAKQRYLNSVVELLITETEYVGEKYVGGMAKFVKKVTSLTQVKDENEIMALRDRLTGRIIDIHVNSFASCIPRDGSEYRAKCAEMGTLNPQNAKPEFCLNCTNALITEGNIKGIWQVIQPMVKEALQEHAFGFLLEAHLPTLKSSWKRITELRNEKNAASVDKILAAITKAINTIESKVKEEEELYA